jgi:hypothetical protein
MKCFAHATQDAVGVCRCCGKGLCPSCAVDLDPGLACRGRCEKEVQEIFAVAREVSSGGLRGTVAKLARSSQLQYSVFLIFLGTLFLMWGLAANPQDVFTTAMGCLFIGYALFGLFFRAGIGQAPPIDQARPSELRGPNHFPEEGIRELRGAAGGERDSNRS